MEGVELNPEVTLLDGDRIQMRSQIRFRMDPSSSDLVQRLRDAKARQVIWDDAASPYAALRPIVEKGECWPETEGDMLILELTYSGSRSEAATVRMRHDLMVPAHIRGLSASHGFAELVRSPKRD